MLWGEELVLSPCRVAKPGHGHLESYLAYVRPRKPLQLPKKVVMSTKVTCMGVYKTRGDIFKVLKEKNSEPRILFSAPLKDTKLTSGF